MKSGNTDVHIDDEGRYYTLKFGAKAYILRTEKNGQRKITFDSSYYDLFSTYHQEID